MKINKKGISNLDNDNFYLDFIESAIKLADPLSFVRLERSNNKLHVNITPSNSDFKQDIINTVLDANRRMKKIIHFSSSLKISKIVSYYLDI